MDRLRQKERVRQRRRKRFLIRQKVRRYVLNEWYFWGGTSKFKEQSLLWEMRKAETRPRCSCMMCGNPRHMRNSVGESLTMQELKFLDVVKEQMEEITP